MSGQEPMVRILKFGFEPISPIEVREVLRHVGVEAEDSQIGLLGNWTQMEFLRSTRGDEVFEVSAWYSIGRMASLVGANAILVGLKTPTEEEVDEFAEGFGGASEGRLLGLFVTEHDGSSDPSDVIRVQVD